MEEIRDFWSLREDYFWPHNCKVGTGQEWGEHLVDVGGNGRRRRRRGRRKGRKGRGEEGRGQVYGAVRLYRAINDWLSTVVYTPRSRLRGKGGKGGKGLGGTSGLVRCETPYGGPPCITDTTMVARRRGFLGTRTFVESNFATVAEGFIAVTAGWHGPGFRSALCSHRYLGVLRMTTSAR